MGAPVTEPGGEQRTEGIPPISLGGEMSGHPPTGVVDRRVGRQHPGIDDHRAGFAHPVEVVADEIDDHRQLRPVLGAVPKRAGEGAVLQVVVGAGACPLDGIRRDPPPRLCEQQLGTVREDGHVGRESDECTERRVGHPKPSIGGEWIEHAVDVDRAGQIDLVAVSVPDPAADPLHSRFVDGLRHGALVERLGGDERGGSDGLQQSLQTAGDRPCSITETESRFVPPEPHAGFGRIGPAGDSLAVVAGAVADVAHDSGEPSTRSNAATERTACCDRVQIPL